MRPTVSDLFAETFLAPLHPLCIETPYWCTVLVHQYGCRNSTKHLEFTFSENQEERPFFPRDSIPILMSCTVKTRKFKLLYFRNETFRPVAGGGAGGAQAPPEIFRLESLLQKWNFCTKVDSCQWNLKFQSIVDHSKIMYCCSSVQFWNCVNERNRIFALPKTTNSFKISAY